MKLGLGLSLSSGNVGSSGGAITDTSAVAFLANFEGADGATSYTEESLNAEAATFYSGAALDTAQFKFGASSYRNPQSPGRIEFPGNILGRAAAPGLTLEWFRKHESPPSSQGTNGRMIHCSASFQIYETHTDTITVSIDGNTTLTGSLPAGTTSDSTNWAHYYIDINHSTKLLRLWFDGSLVISATLSGAGLTTTPGTLYFGNIGTGPGFSSDFQGWLDSVRIVNDLIDLGGTVPTEALTLDGSEART